MSHMEQVKASAGSGKTHDITQRFLAYLAQSEIKPYAPQCVLRNYPPQESASSQGNWGDIMAITFTNSAAAEMKERVLQSLKKCALAKGEAHEKSQEIMSSAQAKAWIDIILRQYGALNIRTIDSLLHLIVRTSALDFGLAPDFESSFHIHEVMDPVFETLLEQAEHGDAAMLERLRAMCHALLFHKETQGFVIGERLVSQLRPLVDMLIMQGGSPFEGLSREEDIEARLVELEQSVIKNAHILCGQLQSEQLKVAKLADVCFSATANGSKKTLGSAYYQKESIDDCLLKASKGQASDVAQCAYLRLKDSVTALVTEGEVLRKALQLYPFFETAALMAQKILAFQEQESKVPASKIPLMAREVLEEHYGVSTALCRLGSSLHHVLLDEFQDTSREQWNALRPLMAEALSQGGSLTWVGDVKQAIYGWRGGDADLFDEVLHTQELTCMSTVSQKSLPTNWRSREVVVKTNNTLFAPLENESTARTIVQAMLSEACPEQVLDAATKKVCRAFKDAGQLVKPQAEGGYVCIEEVQGETVDELNEAVREALHEKLEDLRERRPWSDITILTRTNTAASTVASWLLEWQIPAITENSLLLHTHPLIQESVAFLSFLHCPQDDLSFWTLLTGHMVHAALRHDVSVSDARDVQNYSTDERIQGNVRPSWEELHAFALEPRRGSLAFAFQERWPEFWEYAFAPFYGSAQVLSPYDCMQEWYRLWRVPQRFAEAQTFLRRFLEVIHSAEGRGSGTLGSFLTYWAESGGEEKTPTPTQLEAVRIMTIHKSKGLQFPVVIVPWLSFNIRDDYPPMVQNVGDLRVLAPRTKVSEGQGRDGEKLLGEAHYAAQAEGALECLNVFYVACTRAQEELHAFHTHTSKLLARNNLASGLVELFAHTGIELPLEVGYVIEKQSPVEEADVASACADTVDSAVAIETACPLDFSEEPPRIMQWLPRLKIFRDPLQECLLADDVAEVSQGQRLITARQRGLLVHHCLELLQNMGGGVETVDVAVQRGLQSFALPVSHTQNLQEEITKALMWYATLPGVEEWSHSALPEQGLLDVDDAMYRVDLLLPAQKDRGWRAVEFKTGHHEEAHIRQLRHYLTLLDALPQNSTQQGVFLPPSQGILVYVDLQKCRMVQSDAFSELLDAPLWQGGN